jgi:hypothetical protein
MTVRRRAFIKVLSGVALALLAAGLPFRRSRSASGLKLLELGRRREFRIDSGGTYVARPGGVAHLPEQPRPGDSVTIVVEQESLSSPAIISFTGERLLGTEEDLVLDSLAIFRLTYAGAEAGWINGPLSSETAETFLA